MARRPNWAASLVVVLLLGLLALFHQVVRGAVRQGDLRREATARHTSALFRCRELPDRRAREDCLHKLDAAPTDGLASRAAIALTIAVLE